MGLAYSAFRFRRLLKYHAILFRAALVDGSDPTGPADQRLALSRLGEVLCEEHARRGGGGAGVCTLVCLISSATSTPKPYLGVRWFVVHVLVFMARYSCRLLNFSNALRYIKSKFC